MTGRGNKIHGYGLNVGDSEAVRERLGGLLPLWLTSSTDVQLDIDIDNILRHGRDRGSGPSSISFPIALLQMLHMGRTLRTTQGLSVDGSPGGPCMRHVDKVPGTIARAALASARLADRCPNTPRKARNAPERVSRACKRVDLGSGWRRLWAALRPHGALMACSALL
ncbi:hypothetical protein BD413DRAFT_135641 [Trametes elegans]|nr:hypothetical protein BD413DRAFT_135641 [Trametes elegans]